METLAEQPPLARQEQAGQRKSFDLMASVRLFQYDQQLFGRVLPETRARVRDEQLSLWVEGVDRAARTEFTLLRQGNDLVYFDQARWSSYTVMVLRGREVAAAEAQAEPRTAFLAEAAASDVAHAYRMRQLAPGQQYVWHSPYRQDIENQYGADFMLSKGLKPDRKMGFLYRAYCNQQGAVVLESQTVDNSDDEAFKAALKVAQQNPSADMDALVGAYDTAIMQKNPGFFCYAGRTNTSRHENAWQAMQRQENLINYFLDKLAVITARPQTLIELERNVRKHIYGVWAALKQRLEGMEFTPRSRASGVQVVGTWMLAQEVQGAFNKFAREGMVLVGCGGQIEVMIGEDSILSAEPQDIYDSMFGKSGATKDCEFTSKECPKCHQKNVKTVVKKGVYYGACGCKG